MMHLRRSRQTGVSLIEALVALAVMAIGMLGLVGVQSTLRSTSDVAKQRSEAVRLAQQEIERWRAFTSLNGAGTSYAALVDGTVTVAGIVGTNASFTRASTVATLPAPRAGKSLSVDVSWQDRTGANQRVQLSTLIAGIAPELASTLTVPGDGDVVRQPLGRKRGIPSQAKDLGRGKSGFIPPAGPVPGVAWVFDNVTGLISLCTTTALATADLIYDEVAPGANNVVCGVDKAVLVSGYLRYALGNVQPLTADAALPPSSPNAAPASDLVEMWVNHTTVAAPTPMQCNIEHVNPAPGVTTYFSAYYCAVPVTVIPGVTPTWTGSLLLQPAALMAPNLADFSAAHLKACRYHAAASYALVSEPTANQNFLFTLAGDGAAAFTCPAPTVAHQPAA